MSRNPDLDRNREVHLDSGLDVGRPDAGRRAILGLGAVSLLGGAGVSGHRAAPWSTVRPSTPALPSALSPSPASSRRVQGKRQRDWLAGYAGDNSAGGRSAWARTFYRPQVSTVYVDYETSWAQRAADIGLNRGNFLPPVSNGSAINVLTVGLILAGPRGSKKMNNAGLAAAANGSDKAFYPGFVGIGRAIRAAGLNSPSTVIRLGHEMDGNWFPWSTNKVPRVAADYVRAWRRAHQAIRSVCPRVRFCECWATGGPSSVLDLHYVGDAYVDIIGTDFYDFAEGKSDAAITAAQGGVGIAEIGAYAHAHRKKFSLDEWGLNGRDRRAPHRDSKIFVRWVYDELSALQARYPGVVSHDSYFNEKPYYLFAKNPNAAATYRALWTR